MDVPSHGYLLITYHGRRSDGLETRVVTGYISRPPNFFLSVFRSESKFFQRRTRYLPSQCLSEPPFAIYYLEKEKGLRLHRISHEVRNNRKRSMFPLEMVVLDFFLKIHQPLHLSLTKLARCSNLSRCMTIEKMREAVELILTLIFDTTLYFVVL